MGGFYDSDGTFHTQKVKMISRPYVKLAQGTIVSNKVDKNNGTFEATIKIDTSVTEPSVIHTFSEGKGEPWYPKGFTSFFYDQHDNHIPADKVKIISLDKNQFAFKFGNPEFNGQEIHIELIPK